MTGRLLPRLAAALAAAAEADPGNRYGVPYLWSVTGIGFNVARLDRALGAGTPHDRRGLAFDPRARTRAKSGC